MRWNRKRVESEMDEELRFHLQSYADDLCGRGVPKKEAMRRARVEFGGVEGLKEDCRESLGFRLWDELRSDLRSGFRVLRQSPVFTAVAIISLALGIGANTAIFTLANEFLLKSMGVAHADGLRLFTWTQGPHGHIAHVSGSLEPNGVGGSRGATFPYPLYWEMRQHNEVMDDVAAFKDAQSVTATIEGEAEAVDGILVSGNFYQTLGVRVEAGRPITPADDSPSANGAVVISDAFWASRFGRSADALGKTIDLNSVPLTIVGVNAPEFKGPKVANTPQVFFPLSLQAAVIPSERGELLKKNDFWWLFVMGRLKPGISDEAAGSVLSSAFRNAFHAITPEKVKDTEMPRFVLQPGNRGFDWGAHRLKKPVYLLLSVAGLVLLIACANLANLLLARAAARQREISLRLAMGAGRGRIMRQILTESLLLAFLGGAAGLLLGYAGRNVVPALIESPWNRASIEPQMDWRVFGFAFLMTAVTGLLFGIVPAWRCTRADANAALKETGRMSTSRPKALFGKSLVVFQVALSLVLVVGAGLFLRTLLNLRATPTGLNPEHLVLFEIDPARNHLTAIQRMLLFQRILDGLAATPGVGKATALSAPLLSGSVDTDCYRASGGPEPHGHDPTDTYVGPDFFATFGIPILSGRSLDRRDLQNSPPVAVINQRLANSFFPGRNAIGRTIVSCDANAKPIEVVGVSADVKYTDLRSKAPPTIYFPFTQADGLSGMTFEVRTSASLASIIPKLRAMVRAIDRNLPVLSIRTQTEQIDATLTTERIFAILTSGFGVLALVLAGIGIYGVMAYTVSRRTNEIGIRMALGAEAYKVLRMVLGETCLLACIGICTGLAGAFAATRVVASMLFGVQANDPVTFAGGALLLFAIAQLAALIPAWRAARVDPMNALRHE